MPGDSKLGSDIEAGLDWGFAAVFVASNRFDGSGDSLAETLTVGLRFSLLSPIVFHTMLALWAAGGVVVTLPSWPPT